MTPQRRKQVKYGMLYAACLGHFIFLFTRAETLWAPSHLVVLPMVLGMYYVIYLIFRLGAGPR